MCCGETLWRMSSAVSDIRSLNRSTVAASSARLRSDSRLNSSTDRVIASPSWISFKTNSRSLELFLAAAALSLVSDRFGELGAKQKICAEQHIQNMSTISAPAAP